MYVGVLYDTSMIVLDIEASGVNPEKHSIVSIGALHLENPNNQFYDECRVWDGAHIDPEALKINGFTEEELRDPNKKTEAEIVKAFIAWATDIEGDRTLAGQNVSFDRDFIRLGAERAGIDYPFAFRTIDTHTLAYMHMSNAGVPIPVVNHRSALDLDAILNYCGIPDEPMPHNALTGAMSHAEVASRLLHNKKLLPIFEEFPIPWES